jgi:general stress protein 26
MFRKTALAIIFPLFFFSGILRGQDSSAVAVRSHILSSARKIMEKAGYCALITLGEDGSPQARVVDPFPPDSGMVIRIATKPTTRKIAQIKRDPRVTLFYLNPDGSGYVTVLGRAELITAAREKEKYWKTAWSFFYKDKYLGDDYVIIRIRPRRLEIVSYPDKLVGDPQTWLPVQINFPD